ncbi:MAG: hypothetical protein SF162_20600 [bacterium]|nr:hypothetical protein [bacterium]
MPVVTFFSTRFTRIPLPDAINDVLGHDLAAWLHDAMQTQGYDVDDVIGEDYGYGFWLRLNKRHYWFTTGELEPPGFNGQAESRWLVSLADDPGCFWVYRLRARHSPAEQAALARALHAILQTDPSISGIAWWAQDVYRGTPTAEPPSL